MFSKKEEKEKKNENSENKSSFKAKVNKFKEYCLKDTSKTIFLIIIIVGLYLLLNWGIRKIDLAQIDFTKDKLYTLSDTSKNAVKDLGHETTVYVWGYNEDSSLVDLLKQYRYENKNIDYKVISKDNDPELVEQYYLEDNYSEIIVKSDLKTKYVYEEELFTYDENYNSVDITEQKLTNAILDVNMEEKPVVYFLSGKSNYSTESGMYYLGDSLSKELYEVKSLNLVSTGAVPEDCNILTIPSLTTDLTETEANAIIDYINKGGNMFIMKDIRISDFKEFPNFQKVLDVYGLSMPNKYVVETEAYTVAGAYGYIQGLVARDNEITRLIYNANIAPLLYYPGIIETADSSKLSELKVSINKLVYSSSKAFAIDVESKEQKEGEFTMGLSAEKIVSDGVTSKIVVISSAVSFSDAKDASIGLNAPMFVLDSNYNLAMNSFAYLSSRGEMYSIRKSSSSTKYMPTEAQDRYVRIAITVIPVVIIGIGFIVWFNRRKRS
ncbi:MAG: GldG family protein [Clostridia bacterium]|nr:GldG family protein [Clostridia bacterium]